MDVGVALKYVWPNKTGAAAWWSLLQVPIPEPQQSVASHLRQAVGVKPCVLNQPNDGVALLLLSWELFLGAAGFHLP